MSPSGARDSSPSGIVVVFDQLGVGGSELHTMRLLEALERCGVIVSVVHFQSDGVLLTRLRSTAHRIVHCPVGSLMRPGGWRAVLRLRRHLVALRAKVVHAQCLYANIFCALALGVMPASGVRLVTSRRWDKFSVSRASTSLNRWAHRRSFRVSVNADHLRAVVSREGVAAQRIRYLPNIPDPRLEKVDVALVRAAMRDRFGIPHDAIVIGCVARLQPVKRHADLLHAFRRVHAARADAWLMLVGGGPQQREIEALAASLGIVDRIVLAGEMPSWPPPAAAFDIATLASESEGTPNALIESAFCGVPAVATGVGGVPEVVVEGVTGWLVPPFAPGDMSDALLDLVNDHAKRRAFGTASRAHMETHYSGAVGIGQLLDLYADAGWSGRTSEALT